MPREGAVAVTAAERERLWFWLAAMGIVATILWTHGSVLSAGFRADDYFVIRPWTAAEIRSVLTGSWDPFGFQDPYHRPVTALYQAAWYPVFGFNARAMHALSLFELGLVAAGLATFVTRELRRPAAGLLAALVLIVHPMLPDSTSAWIFNQMSLIADLTVVGALLLWQRVRAGSARRWWPVWAMCACSFYIKEDGAMLVPALLTVQWWRARATGDVPRPSRAVIMSGVATLTILAIVRLAVYPVAAPWPPSWSNAGYYLRNLLSGPFHVLLRLPGDSDAGLVGNAVVVLALVAAATLAWRSRIRAAAPTLLVSGAILMAWLGAPLLFNSGPTRAHLITLAASLMISASMVIVFDTAPDRRARRLVLSAIVVALFSLSLASREMNGHYAPCSDDSLHQDDYVVTWDVVAPELRAWVDAKRGACAAGRYRPLPAHFAVSRPRL